MLDSRKLPVAVALLACVVLSACEPAARTVGSSWPEAKGGPRTSALGVGCPRFSTPIEPPVTTTNTGQMLIVNAACAPALAYNYVNGGVFFYRYLYPGDRDFFSGTTCLTTSMDLPPSGGTCFTGPSAGELPTPVPLKIYSGPISTRPIKRRIRCSFDGIERSCLSSAGVRG